MGHGDVCQGAHTLGKREYTVTIVDNDGLHASKL